MICPGMLPTHKWATLHADAPSPRVFVSDLAVTSIGETKSPNSTALRLGVSAGSGAQRVEIDHVLVYVRIYFFSLAVGPFHRLLQRPACL